MSLEKERKFISEEKNGAFQHLWAQDDNYAQ
jgi:hypothetical protein